MKLKWSVMVNRGQQGIQFQQLLLGYTQAYIELLMAGYIQTGIELLMAFVSAPWGVNHGEKQNLTRVIIKYRW